MLEQEQFVYLIRLVKEDYTASHTRAFIDKAVAEEYFLSDVKFFRKKGWSVSDEEYCGGGNIIRRAEMVKKNEDGKYERMSLHLEAHEIIKK